jgi:hypothetical protein
MNEWKNRPVKWNRGLETKPDFSQLIFYRGKWQLNDEKIVLPIIVFGKNQAFMCPPEKKEKINLGTELSSHTKKYTMDHRPKYKCKTFNTWNKNHGRKFT